VPPKVREVIRRLERDGWRRVGTAGSHRHYEHPTRPGKVTVAGHENEDMHPKTWASIQRQAGWRR
jgi:predicted RNA binding protein YcfA (HicA-like mRNA interferase family)